MSTTRAENTASAKHTTVVSWGIPLAHPNPFPARIRRGRTITTTSEPGKALSIIALTLPLAVPAVALQRELRLNSALIAYCPAHASTGSRWQFILHPLGLRYAESVILRGRAGAHIGAVA